MTRLKIRRVISRKLLSYSDLPRTVCVYSEIIRELLRCQEVPCLRGPRSNDSMLDIALGQLAITYLSLRDWAKADSLFQIGLAASSRNLNAQAVILSNYAQMKVLQPEPEPECAISLLDILIQIEKQATKYPIASEAWISQCALAIGDYELAYGSLSRG